MVSFGSAALTNRAPCLGRRELSSNNILFLFLNIIFP
jgi:hypothetical protein